MSRQETSKSVGETMNNDIIPLRDITTSGSHAIPAMTDASGLDIKVINDSQLGDVADCMDAPIEESPSVHIDRKQKYILLVLFCIVQFFDGTGRSGIFALTTPIAEDLGIKYETSTWIINAYSLTFAAILPLSGLLSDLLSAKPVFSLGVMLSGITNLVTSFLPDQYAFFVIRAVSGLAAAMTVPSAFRLTSHIFSGETEVEKHERKTGLMWLGVVGSLANSVGKIILGGAFGSIPTGGQMAGWRWFFRFVAGVLLPLGVLTHVMAPNTHGTLFTTGSTFYSNKNQPVLNAEVPQNANSQNGTHFEFRSTYLTRKLDLPAVLLLLSSIILLVLSLTLAASCTTIMPSSKAFTSPTFLVPFLLSWPLLIGFFVWESRRGEGFAMIPSGIWKISNVALVGFVSLELLAYWVIVQLPYIQRWEMVNHESTILAALRALPSGLAAFAPAFVLPCFLSRLNLRVLLISGIAGTIVALTLFTLSDGRRGKWYFAFVMPAFIIGSFFNQCAVTAANLLIIMSVPPNMAGTASAIVQVALQVGCSIALAFQASFLTIHPGGLADFRNLQISYYFQIGWAGLCIVLLLVLYRKPKKAQATTAA